MKTYEISYARGVKKDFRAIDKKYHARIMAAIYELANNPRPAGIKKLVGYDGHYRLRVGDYRVIYEIHDGKLTILVVEVGHRKDIYR